VIPPDWTWAVFVLIAAAAQTVRNATQRRISGSAGTLGATYARFVYGLPFALAFLAALTAVRGVPALPGWEFLGWTVLAALTQVLATVCLLGAMGRSFSFAIAMSNTSPVQVAIFAFLILGEPLTVGVALSVLAVTFGTILLSWPRRGTPVDPASILLGLGSGALFSIASVGYRGATLGSGMDFLMAASFTLAVAMVLQSLGLTAWLMWRAPGDLKAVFSGWKFSLLAGFTGAFASLLWFCAYALETVARVRTLAVIEVLFAQLVSLRFFREGTSARELIGLALVILGVVLVVNA